MDKVKVTVLTPVKVIGGVLMPGPHEVEAAVAAMLLAAGVLEAEPYPEGAHVDSVQSSPAGDARDERIAELTAERDAALVRQKALEDERDELQRRLGDHEAKTASRAKPPKSDVAPAP